MNIFPFRKKPPANPSPAIRQLEIPPARLPVIKTKGRIYGKGFKTTKLLIDTGLATPCGIPILLAIPYQENEHEN